MTHDQQQNDTLASLVAHVRIYNTREKEMSVSGKEEWPGEVDPRLFSMNRIWGEDENFSCSQVNAVAA